MPLMDKNFVQRMKHQLNLRYSRENKKLKFNNLFMEEMFFKLLPTARSGGTLADLIIPNHSITELKCHGTSKQEPGSDITFCMTREMCSNNSGISREWDDADVLQTLVSGWNGMLRKIASKTPEFNFIFAAYDDHCVTLWETDYRDLMIDPKRCKGAWKSRRCKEGYTHNFHVSDSITGNKLLSFTSMSKIERVVTIPNKAKRIIAEKTHDVKMVRIKTRKQIAR